MSNLNERFLFDEIVTFRNHLMHGFIRHGSVQNDSQPVFFVHVVSGKKTFDGKQFRNFFGVGFDV